MYYIALACYVNKFVSYQQDKLYESCRPKKKKKKEKD